MENVCKEQGVLFLDPGLLNNSDFDDGLHPNAVGHQKIFEVVRNFLIKNNWI